VDDVPRICILVTAADMNGAEKDDIIKLKCTKCGKEILCSAKVFQSIQRIHGGVR